ncbi:MAG: DUF6607 family protein [Pseudomonadota bacterium]
MRFTLFSVLLVLATGAAIAEDAAPASQGGSERQYTFSWNYAGATAMKPRGGTTKGPAVTLDTRASEQWQQISEPGLTSKERDRRAILAMAGGYRTSFDFLETVGYVPNYQPPRPYRSWGTEYVYVVEDSPEFVSLQHIIVMFFIDGEGEVQGPAVIKHWRQDWRYEDTSLHVYAGHNRWQRQDLDPADVKGTWSQSVYQVDDSPRYQAYGRWEHHGNYSSWLSSKTWRPLPRREYSVRDDYHVLEGTNRHTITPTGWVQEENNLKLVLTADGRPDSEVPYLAREQGMARYERIVDHDFSGGDVYWERTGPFWQDVRDQWDVIFEKHPEVTLRKRIDDKSLFAVMFDFAGNISEETPYDAKASRQFVEATLAQWMSDETTDASQSY